MSDNEAPEAPLFSVGVSPSNRATCTASKGKKVSACLGAEPKIDKGVLRFSKSFKNDTLGHDVEQHFHLRCFTVAVMPKARASTVLPKAGSELLGYEALTAEQRAEVDAAFAEGIAAVDAIAAEKAAKEAEKAASKGKKRKAAKEEEGEGGEEAAPKKKKAAPKKAAGKKGKEEEVVVADEE